MRGERDDLSRRGELVWIESVIRRRAGVDRQPGVRPVGGEGRRGDGEGSGEGSIGSDCRESQVAVGQLRPEGQLRTAFEGVSLVIAHTNHARELDDFPFLIGRPIGGQEDLRLLAEVGRNADDSVGFGSRHRHHDFLAARRRDREIKT